MNHEVVQSKPQHETIIASASLRSRKERSFSPSDSDDGGDDAEIGGGVAETELRRCRGVVCHEMAQGGRFHPRAGALWRSWRGRSRWRKMQRTNGVSGVTTIWCDDDLQRSHARRRRGERGAKWCSFLSRPFSPLSAVARDATAVVRGRLQGRFGWWKNWSGGNFASGSCLPPRSAI